MSSMRSVVSQVCGTEEIHSIHEIVSICPVLATVNGRKLKVTGIQFISNVFQFRKSNE